MQKLLDEGYEFIFTCRFQSDPFENVFFQYRQMSGSRFLASLREVSSTERILTCWSLLKQNSNFWEENLKPVLKNDKILNILAQHESEINKLFLLPASKEVIIMSRRQRGYPWPSLAISPYHSSPPAGLQGYILCPHIVAVCRFVLVVPLLHIHMWGSTGVHRLWARPCFSSSVLRVWFVELV